jgi:hypothetical protein
MAAPDPCGEREPATYGEAADAIAKAMLLLAEEDPGSRDTADAWDSYEAVCKKWPDFDEWVHGATGFQAGWATNCVRWLSEKPPVANPALIQIETKD